MKRFFAPNLQTRGRIARGLVAFLVFAAAAVSFHFSLILGFALLASGLFVLFEALRGWCALRACGIKTKL